MFILHTLLLPYKGVRLTIPPPDYFSFINGFSLSLSNAPNNPKVIKITKIKHNTYPIVSILFFVIRLDFHPNYLGVIKCPPKKPIYFFHNFDL